MSLNFGGINIGGESGGQVKNQDKTFTINGEFTADEGYTGLGTVTVDVEGGVTTEELTVTPTTTTTTYTPTESDAYSKVVVNGVTNSIDANITAGNIKNGVSILGVSGSVIELNGETKTVTPTTSEQTITPTSPKNAITSVTVSAVTSSIDANITAGNIKKDVQILGVTGTYEGSGGGSSFPPSPVNMAGLSFWIDGDCNTRTGLDRTAKYMDDLVYNDPYTHPVGHFEEHTPNTDLWLDSGNLLMLNDGVSIYPQQKCTTNNEFTIELVIKQTSSFTGTPVPIISFGTSAMGGVEFNLSPDRILYTFFKDTSGTDHTFFPGSFAVNDVIYCYLKCTSSNITIAYPGKNATSTLQVHPKATTKGFNTGFNCQANTTAVASGNNGKVAVGMVRYWQRALTSEELTACYNDAKTRFNCL